MANMLTRVFGSRNQRLLRQYGKVVNKINALEESLQAALGVARMEVVVDLLAAHPFPLVRRIRQGLERLRETVAGRRAAAANAVAPSRSSDSNPRSSPMEWMR